MNPKAIPPKVVEYLGYYVYLYVDPFDNSVFYVGKGKGQRALAHLSDTADSRKVKKIKEIRARGKEPRIEILVHGLLSEQEALRIESAAIDLLGKDSLKNEVRGWESSIVGRMSLKDVTCLYESQSAKIDDPVILIRINQLYRYGMSDQELYEATRGVWKVGERRNTAQYALAVYRGIVREVYQIDGWYPAGKVAYQTRSKIDVDVLGRWEFVGRPATDSIREKYVDHSVIEYFAPNSQNPIKYVKCGK